MTSPPLESGFGHFYGFLGAEVAYFHHTSRNRQVDWQRNGETIHETGYSTFLLSDEAIRLIQERDQQMPFYLQVSFNAPHVPLAAPADYEAMYSEIPKSTVTRTAMIDALDNAIGRVLETVDEEGLRGNTLVLFISDNGADQSGRNAPFRSGKGSVCKGGIHVPCMMRWPAAIESGTARCPCTTLPAIPKNELIWCFRIQKQPSGSKPCSRLKAKVSPAARPIVQVAGRDRMLAEIIHKQKATRVTNISSCLRAASRQFVHDQYLKRTDEVLMTLGHLETCIL